jgi:Uma2 family endonuclease
MLINPLLTILDLSFLSEDGICYQLIEGELVMSVMPSLSHQRAVFSLLFLLGKYLAQNPVGEVIPGPALVFNDFTYLVADIVYISNSRRGEIIASEQICAAPELVIEVLSASIESSHKDRRIKRQLYQKYGVKEYWLVCPEQQNIEIYQLPKLELTKILSGRDVVSSPLLEGFYCLSQEIFKIQGTS